jgi:hypothetical protein
MLIHFALHSYLLEDNAFLAFKDSDYQTELVLEFNAQTGFMQIYMEIVNKWAYYVMFITKKDFVFNVRQAMGQIQTEIASNTEPRIHVLHVNI